MVFKIAGRDIPIVHRVMRAHYPHTNESDTGMYCLFVFMYIILFWAAADLTLFPEKALAEATYLTKGAFV